VTAAEHHLEPEDLPAAFRRGSAFEGLLPLIAYIAGERLGTWQFGEVSGDRIAIAAMSLAAVWSGVQRHLRGQSIGWWIPGLFVYLLVRGIAGLVWGEDVFLAFGIGVKVALGVGALVSVVIGRPLAHEFIHMVLPFTEAVRAHPVFRRTFRNVTLAYAIYQLISVAFEIWLLDSTESGTGFLVIRTLVGWVAGFVGFFIALFYVDAKLKPIDGFDGVMPMMEEIGEALEADRARNGAR